MILIFDIGGVCLSNYWGKEEREKFSQKFDLNYAKVWEYQKKYKKEINIGKISEKEYFEGLLKEQKSRVCVEEAINFVKSLNKKDDNVLSYIESLKNKHQIYALTNEIKEAAIFRIQKFNLDGCFDKIFISSEIGYMKPSEEIYSYVIKKINSSQDMVFIDNQKDLLEMPKRLDSHTIHFTNLENLKKEIESIEKSVA